MPERSNTTAAGQDANLAIDLQSGRSVILISLILYMAIVLGKLLAGFLLNSGILQADGLHDLTDFFSFLSVYVAVKIASKSPNKKFPYGFMKIDSIVSLFLAVGFLVASYFVVVEGIDKLINPSAEVTSFIPAIVSAASTILVFFISKKMLKKGKELSLNSLVAIGRDKYIDSFMGIAIAASLVLVWFQVPFVEGIMELVLGALIIASATISAKDGILGLMDVGMKQDDVEKIEELLKNEERIEDFKDLKFRKAGPFYFGDVSIIIPPHIPSEQAVYIAGEIKGKILSKNKKIAILNVSIDIQEKIIKNIMIPIEDGENGLESVLSDHFGRAKNYIYVSVDTSKKEILDHYIEANVHVKKEVRAGLATIKTLTREKVDVLITKNLGEIAFASLQQKLIEIFKPLAHDGKKVTAKEAIQGYLEGKMPKHERPTRDKD